MGGHLECIRAYYVGFSVGVWDTVKFPTRVTQGMNLIIKVHCSFYVQSSQGLKTFFLY